MQIGKESPIAYIPRIAVTQDKLECMPVWNNTRTRGKLAICTLCKSIHYSL